MISVRDQPESQYKRGNSSRTTVFLAKRASTSDADGPKAFLYQVSASESYWSSQETSATTFLTLLSIRPCTGTSTAARGLCVSGTRRGMCTSTGLPVPVHTPLMLGSPTKGRPLNAGIDHFQEFGGVAVEPQWQSTSRDVRVSCKLLHLIAHSSGPLLTDVPHLAGVP